MTMYQDYELMVTYKLEEHLHNARTIQTKYLEHNSETKNKIKKIRNMHSCNHI